MTLRGEALTEDFLKVIENYVQANYSNRFNTEDTPWFMAFTKKPTLASQADRHDLYQNSVQDVVSVIDFVQETWEELPPMFCTSSVSKKGKDEVLNYIQDIIDNKVK